MPAAPRLVPVREPGQPLGAVIVLHGGASRPGRPPVSPTQLSVIRMIPTARAVAHAGRGRLAVYRLLNRYRGWDTEHTPVADAVWAMGQIGEKYAGLPIGLVGHSLGGRAALLAGEQPEVTSVVALNPWVYETDAPRLGGKRVLVVHGTEDRIASPARSEAVARRIISPASGPSASGYISIPGAKHAMLAHGRDFDGYAAQFTAAALLGPDLAASRLDPSGPVGRVLAGEQWVTV